jgi:ABC-2 type transport system permease protein
MNWEQIKTIFWLRWRLICNQSRRDHGAGIVVSILIGVAAGTLTLAAFAGGLLGGLFGLAKASPIAVWLTWFVITIVFLFFWLLGLIMELQRSETIDLQKLMHLPVALGQMFVINFLVSHFTLSIVIVVPAMFSLALGLALSRGIEMALLVPLAAATIFMISAWTYCFRGWLAQLMTNPRRRRAIIMYLTFSLILIGQGPNLFFRLHPHHTGRDNGNKLLDDVFAVQPYVPPLWLPCGARALASGNPVPALLGTLGCFAIGALGLRRAYRSTLRFYHGEIGGRAAVKIKIPVEKAAAGQPPNQKTGFLELRLPYVPEQAAALALATFRSLLRAPEVKMILVTAFVVPVIVGATFFLRGPTRIPDEVKPFAATGAAVFSAFMLIQFLTNQFGFDRDGFRSLMLSSADRRFILLGKNLACLPIAVGPGVFLLGLICVPLRLPPLTVFATFLQLITVCLMMSMTGNLISILAPQHIAPGTLRPTKPKIQIVLLMVVLQLFFMAAMAPIFLPAVSEWLWRRGGLPGVVPVNFIFSAALLGVMVLVYWQTLGPLGRLLQRREIKILQSVTAEVE